MLFSYTNLTCNFPETYLNTLCLSLLFATYDVIISFIRFYI